MATNEGTYKMVDNDGKEYSIDVHSTINKTLAKTSKIFDYWYDGQIVLKQPDGKFKIRDSGIILTKIG